MTRGIESAGLYQAGPGQVVVDEALGAEPGQQALRHALLQVQVHRVVGEHAGVLEHDRADGGVAPPLGQLLVAPARHAQRIQGGLVQLASASVWPVRGGNVQVGEPSSVRCSCNGLGPDQLQRAGQRGTERLRLEVDPAA